jgi:hypothetical protein
MRKGKKMNENEKRILSFIACCFADDNGVPDEAYGMLCAISRDGARGFSGEFQEQLDYLLQATDGTDGRVYIS